jgi:hypothetical protein
MTTPTMSTLTATQIADRLWKMKGDDRAPCLLSEQLRREYPDQVGVINEGYEEFRADLTRLERTQRYPVALGAEL